MSVDTAQRFKRSRPCPICGGYDEATRGKGERCYGFLSSDGKYAHCTRAERAGELPLEADAETYAHRLEGQCKCGREHGYAKAAKPVNRQAAKPRHPPAGIEKAYLYSDENGQPLFSVLRYPDKSFLQARPAVEDPQSRIEDWWLGLNGTRRVLYRLPELLSADPLAPLFLCEGEKDADRLISEGLVATTGPMGAKHWDQEYAEQLHGRRVIVLGDNDEDGRKGALRKAESLAGIATSAKVLVFDELPEGGDVSDWLDSGHTADELVALAESSVPAGPVLLHTISAIELLAKILPPVLWAVQGLLPEGLTLFVGKTKMGKSWAALALALAIALGGRVFGQIPVDSGEVLYLALEDSERRLQSRISRLTEDQPVPDGLYLAVDWPRVDEGGLGHLEDWLKEHPRTRFIIVDTLKRIRPFVGMQKSVYDADYESIQGLQQLATRHHVAVLVVHHMRKLPADDPLDSINGSSGLLAAADGIWVLLRERMSADATLYVVHREGEDQELALTWNPTLTTWTLVGDAQEYRVSKERQEIIDLLIDAGDAMTPKEISEALGRNYGTTKVMLRNMLKAEDLTSVGKGRYAADRSHKPHKPINPEQAVISLFPQADAEKEAAKEAISRYMDRSGINRSLPRQQAENDDSVYGFTQFTGEDNDDIEF